MDWESLKLGDIATFINGYPFKPADWADSGTPIIRIQDLTKSNRTECNYYRGEIAEKYKVIKGDILISWSATLGIYIWKEDYGWLNQHIFKVQFDKIEIDKSFFMHLIENVLDHLKSQVHGATMKHITKGDFDNTIVKVPSLPIQKRIAEILNKADDLRKKDLKLLEYYNALAQSLFINIFGDPVNNERDWKIKSLSELGQLDRGVSKHRPRNAPELLGGKYPLIQTGDVANSGGTINYFKSTYSDIGLAQSKLWNKGTLCITIAANIAKTGILNFDACFPDSIVGFIPNDLSNNYFIQFLFKFLQKILEDAAPESAQKNINLEILRSLKIIAPPIYLQNEFAIQIQNIEKQKEKVKAQIIGSENLFQALLNGAFK